jgi:hypothetical protein
MADKINDVGTDGTTAIPQPAKPKDDGGPAFPVGDQSTHPLMVGMCLRDYFAAKALAGILASEVNESSTAEANALMAYAHADAMLSERGKRNG